MYKYIERCEWDPINRSSAVESQGCTRAATLSVGTKKKNFHLCDECAKDPYFARLTKRVPLGRAVSA